MLSPTLTKQHCSPRIVFQTTRTICAASRERSDALYGAVEIGKSLAAASRCLPLVPAQLASCCTETSAAQPSSVAGSALSRQSGLHAALDVRLQHAEQRSDLPDEVTRDLQPADCPRMDMADSPADSDITPEDSQTMDEFEHMTAAVTPLEAVAVAAYDAI